MNVAVRVPARKPREGQDPRFQPHVLVITDPGDGLEKEWEIEHPDACPEVCAWYPPLPDGRPWFEDFADEFGFHGVEKAGHRACYVQHEIDHNGIDSLTVVSHRERDGDSWRDVAPFADPSYVAETGFEAEWLRLRPGRYLIEGWYQSGVGQGELGGMGDADGGLTILGLAP